MNNKGIIGIVVLIVALCAVMYGLQHVTPPGEATPPPPPPAPVIPAQTLGSIFTTLQQNAATQTPLGNPNAPYTVIEIGDFQCPNCGKAEPMVLSAITHSGGKAKLYFYNFPIPQLHPHALIAAQAGLAAAAQGKFWPMYEMLYSHQDELIDSQIEFNARQIPGLNVAQFTSDLESGKYIPLLQQQVETIQQIQTIESVPTVLLKDPSGKISVYEGANPTAKHMTYPGIIKLVQNPPWKPTSATIADAGNASPGT